MTAVLLQGETTIARMGALAGVSRAGTTAIGCLGAALGRDRVRDASSAWRWIIHTTASPDRNAVRRDDAAALDEWIEHALDAGTRSLCMAFLFPCRCRIGMVDSGRGGLGLGLNHIHLRSNWSLSPLQWGARWELRQLGTPAENAVFR